MTRIEKKNSVCVTVQCARSVQSALSDISTTQNINQANEIICMTNNNKNKTILKIFYQHE